MIYRAPLATALLVEPLDPLTLVFHRDSGITHVLASPAPEILAVLAGDGLSLDMLMGELERGYDLGDADPAALAARVGELVAAGLVTTA